MKMNENQQRRLRRIPGVDTILESAHRDSFFEAVPKSVLLQAIRTVFDGLRKEILDNQPAPTEDESNPAEILDRVKARVHQAMTPNLRRVVNATGVVVHTNLGRSLLSQDAMDNLTDLAGHYSNLEFDLAKGRRGSRYTAVEDLLCEITGAEAAMVVNNNAGAVFLSLETIARGKSAIVSRGELVEIGGSFRIPDVMTKSGARLVEVGTTNRTHFRDYEGAITDDTGLLLKVHTSNYSIVGFTSDVPLTELAELGRRYHIPVMEDLGSGTFVDFSDYGLTREPTVQASVAAGVDLVTFSGDKLLGGPQAGIIVGTKEYIDKIKTNPLNRALRIDKLTLGALESTLRHYRDPEKAVAAIPTLKMLTLPMAVIEKQAHAVGRLLSELADEGVDIAMAQSVSKAGGGSLPLLELPTLCVSVAVSGMSANALEHQLRKQNPAIIGRIENDRFYMDARTIQDDDIPAILDAFKQLLSGMPT